MLRWLKDVAVTGMLLAISLGVPASVFARLVRQKEQRDDQREEQA